MVARLRAASERVFIEHEPNASSGGQTTHIEIGDFLMHGGHGPCCGLSEHWSRSPLGPERTGGAAALMGGQPGKPSPPGNPPTPREPQRPPVEEPPRPIPVPPVERPPAPMQVDQGAAA